MDLGQLGRCEALRGCERCSWTVKTMQAAGLCVISICRLVLAGGGGLQLAGFSSGLAGVCALPTACCGLLVAFWGDFRGCVGSESANLSANFGMKVPPDPRNDGDLGVTVDPNGLE